MELEYSRDTLVALSASFRQDDTKLFDHLDRLELLFDLVERNIAAFVPEEKRFERLRRQARVLVARYPDPARRPRLFGVPIGVKDIFQVGGFETHAGSRLPTSELRGPEAESVSRLKAAGALILGKTNTTEFAYFAPGPTRNPHNLEHTPGGSSSGSAAAVAAGLCTLALGTQTIGSIIRPASFCGVVGFKPSYERISRAGVIPLAPSVDHVGLFTANARDAQFAASLLMKDWQSDLPKRKPVLGMPEGPYLEHTSEEGVTHFRAVCQRLSAAGFPIRSVAAMSDFDNIVERHNRLVAAEAAQVHAEWFSRYRELYHPRTAELIERGREVSAEELSAARRGREKLRQELSELMNANDVDLWIAPSAPGAAPKGLESTGSPIMNLPWTHAGLPVISLPSGTDGEGLPCGLQVVGEWYADERLLAWAVDLEAALGFRTAR